MENADYKKYSEEELNNEQKKIKKNETISTFIIGFMVGIIVYGIAKSGFGFLFVVISVLIIVGVYRNSQKNKEKLKEIKGELESRNQER